jgi:hypothetical protein
MNQNTRELLIEFGAMFAFVLGALAFMYAVVKFSLWMGGMSF